VSVRGANDFAANPGGGNIYDAYRQTRGRASTHATQDFFRVRIPILKAKFAKKRNGSCSRPALQDGVLKTADQNARTTVSRMLTGLGFEQVEISVAE